MREYLQGRTWKYNNESTHCSKSPSKPRESVGSFVGSICMYIREYNRSLIKTIKPEYSRRLSTLVKCLIIFVVLQPRCSRKHTGHNYGYNYLNTWHSSIRRFIFLLFCIFSLWTQKEFSLNLNWTVNRTYLNLS